MGALSYYSILIMKINGYTFVIQFLIQRSEVSIISKNIAMY